MESATQRQKMPETKTVIEYINGRLAKVRNRDAAIKTVVIKNIRTSNNGLKDLDTLLLLFKSKQLLS